MRKHWLKANLRVYLVIFLGILILDWLILCPILFYNWRDSVRGEAQYQMAPLCTSSQQSGCRREIESVVKETYSIYSRDATTHYVSLLMPGSHLNGNIPIWWKMDHSLYDLLKQGDRVTAEEWEGQIVVIRGAHNGILRTEYDPTYRREGLITALIVLPLLTILLIFIEYKLIRSIRKGRINRNEQAL